MLQSDPAKRPTAAQALEHEWFRCDKQVISELLTVNNMMCSGFNENEDGDNSHSSFISSFKIDKSFQTGKNEKHSL
jgi:serine/threonine protein kinase